MTVILRILFIFSFLLSVQAEGIANPRSISGDSAITLINRGHHKEAIEFLTKALSENDLQRIDGQELRLLRSGLHLRMGDFTNAYKDAWKVYTLSKAQPVDDSVAGTAAKLLVEINGNLEEYSDARRFSDECKRRYSRSGSLHLYAEGLQVKGNFLRSIGEIDSAKIFLDSCIRLSRENGFSQTQAKALNNRGIINAIEGNMPEAFGMFNESLHLLRGIPDPDETLCEVINNLTFYYILHEELDTALSMARWQIALSKEMNYPMTLVKGNLHLAKVFESKGLFDSAYLYTNRHYVLKDSLFNAEVNQKINWSKFQSELEIVQVQNELMRAELSASNAKMMLVSVLAFLAMLVIALLIWLNLKRIKENKVLFDRVQELLDQSRLDDGDRNDSPSNYLKDDVADAVFIALKQWEVEKGFLVKDCTLEHVAKQCNTNSKYLSMVITSNYAQRFPEYLNTKRIMYMLEQLQADAKLRTYTIEALSDLAGYRSKTSFGNAFKSYTGLTPSVYISELTKNLGPR